MPEKIQDRVAASARVTMSNAQRMIWAGHQRDPSAPVFSTAWSFEFDLPLDPERFRQAFDAVVAGCDALRLTVEENDDGVDALVDAGKGAGEHESLSLQTNDDARRWMEDAVKRPFDPSHRTFHSALISVAGVKAIWFLNQHHLLTDASSSKLIFDAVMRAYRGEPVGELPQFSDYLIAEDQSAVVQSKDQKTKGSGTESATERRTEPRPLPRIYGRPVDKNSSEAVMETVPLGRDRSARLERLLQDSGFGALSRPQALFNFFGTVLGAWMSRVSGETQVPVGVVSHGRQTLSMRRTIGCFIELFPMELEFRAGTTFREAHGAIVEAAFELLKHAVPGTSTVEGLSRFDTVLNVIPANFAGTDGRTVKTDWLNTGAIDQHHAFRLNVMELGGDQGVELAMAFHGSVFDSQRRDAATRHIFAFVDAFLYDPDCAIDAVPLSDPSDASTALVAADMRAELTPAADVIDEFEASVAENGEQVVLHEGSKLLSRSELSRRADAVVMALRNAGIEPGDRVGVHLTRSADCVASMLGILKAGATFVPLDPGQPAGRLSTICELAGLSLIIMEEGLPQFDKGEVETLDLATLPSAISELVEAGPKTHAAYVIFTSGSTGTPKGVVIGRPSLVRYAAWAATTFAGANPASWAFHSAIGFDLTITSIFAPLVSEGSIIAYRDDPSSTDLSVLDVFRDGAAEIVKLTPAHLRLALETPLQKGKIRSLVLGGEALPVDLCRRAISALGPDLKIFNEYGPTEATVGCMVHRFDPETDTGATVPIGRPADATGIYVLDSAQNPVADEVPGEIYIGGPERLATGYFNRPDETASAFVANPFASGLMYRTGDLASVSRDGTILYHGRIDDQLKMSGVRIEPAEIEAQARVIPGVTSATVTLFNHREAADQLCENCGVPRALPNVRFVRETLCKTCAEFESYSARVADYFGDLDELRKIVSARSQSKSGAYDCVMLLSGGKDSTYALSRLSEITPRILAATLDNGFISDEAKKNIVSITERLGIEHRFLKTPAMNEIFVDSLKRHANVCNGCFKTIYTLALHLAQEIGAPTIVTGLSRGQLFETRLAPDLFEGKSTSRGAIDEMVLAARRSYHAFPDTAAKKLNGGIFDSGDVLSDIEFVDFYRYCDVPVSEIYSHLEGSVGWTRPKDTGRSTNCLINDVGIHVHRLKRKHHNYALPYSWDVRLGHKTRHEALEELQDEINTKRVEEILDEIGYDEPLNSGADPEARLVLYYTSDGNVSPQDIRRNLLGVLPREIVPAAICQVDEIPLTANGKVNFHALPTPDFNLPSEEAQEVVDDSDLTEAERRILEIWRRVLGRVGISAQSNFYDVGGDSLSAIQIAAQCTKTGLAVTAQDIFRHQSVSAIASNLKIDPPLEPVERKVRPNPAALSDRNKAKLQALFGKKSDG